MLLSRLETLLFYGKFLHSKLLQVSEHGPGLKNERWKIDHYVEKGEAEKTSPVGKVQETLRIGVCTDDVPMYPCVRVGQRERKRKRELGREREKEKEGERERKRERER
jgi:hypothetical protein